MSQEALPAPAPGLFGLRPTWQTWLIYAALMVAVAWICFGSLADHLLDTHDDELFRDSAALRENPAFFFAPAREKAVGSGRPLADLVESVPYLIWGPDPAPYHLFAALLHLLASLLLAYLAWELGMGLGLSMAGGLLFLVNVAHFQAVHWISGMDYPVALLLSLGAVQCWRRYEQTRRPVWRWGFCAALPLGALAHPAVLMTWPLCLYWAWSQGRPLRPLWRTLLPLALLMAPTLAFISYTTAERTSTSRALSAYSLENLPQLAAGIGELLLWFSSRLLTTAHWTVVAVYQQQTWELGIGLAGLAGLGWLAWKRPLPAAPWAAWTLLMLLPFLVLTEEVVRDLPAGPSRYLYLATAGSSLLLAWLLEQGSLYLGRWLRPQLPFAAAIALLQVSSFVFLKKAEALTFYTSGRNYIALGDAELGARQLQRAIVRAPETIPLLDAYSRLCLQLMGTADLEPTLSQALQQFPNSIHLNLYQSVSHSLSPDPAMQQNARERFVSRLGVLQGPQRQEAEQLVFQAYANYGLNRTEHDDFLGAIPALRLALDYNPGSIKIYRRLILALMRTSQTEEGMVLAQQVVAQHPDDPGIPGLRALVLRLQGRVDEAITVCRQAIAAHPSEDLFALLGEFHEHQGASAKARETYQECLRLFPSYQLASRRLAELALRNSDQTNTIQSLEQATQLEPEVAVNYYNLGNRYYGAKRFEEAVSAYQEAIRRGFRDPRVYANLGTTLRNLKLLPEAEQAYRQAITLQPDNPTFYHNLGGVEQEQGDRRSGVAAFERAIALGSDNIETYLGLTQLYQENGQLEEGLRIYAQILHLDLRGGTGQLYAKMGADLAGLGRQEEAATAYRKALEKDPDNLVAHVNLGWCLYLRGEFQGAIAHYQKALALQPSSQAQFNLGLAYLRLGQVQLARKTYEEGNQRYGADEARRVGAVDDLKQLIAQRIQADQAQKILHAYWP
jgi:tetratricopeptide (TPR) repeat protein